MDIIKDISIYLPQYLSAEDKDVLKSELRAFVEKGTLNSIYTSANVGKNYFLQGDCIDNFIYFNLPDVEGRQVKVMLLSNTCDMSKDNTRLNDPRVLYAPVINLKKYEDLLLRTHDKGKVDNHIKDIKGQRVTQAMFIPQGAKLEYDAVVFFDRTINMPLSKIDVEDKCNEKVFTFSDFGFYLFLFKLSLHYTRIKEGVHRLQDED